MKTIIKLLISTFILSFLAATAHADDQENTLAERLSQALKQLQQAEIITEKEVAYLEQNAVRTKGAKCDSSIITPILITIARSKGCTSNNVNDVLDFFREKNMLSTPDYYKKELSKGSITGVAARNLLLRLSKYVQ